jgi:hypothetical protein
VVGVFVTTLAWPFPHVWEQRIGTAESPANNPSLVVLYGNKKLDGQTIVTGGRAGVLNGLVIPAFQIKSTKNVTMFGVRLYLSEGDGRWDGPWEPTPSDEDAFPAEFYWGAGFQLNSQETWNTPAFTAQRSKGIPWGRTIKARIKIYYGASAPLTVDFTLHNNETTPASKAVPAPSDEGDEGDRLQRPLKPASDNLFVMYGQSPYDMKVLFRTRGQVNRFTGF